MMRRNEDFTRVVNDEAAFGIACYEGTAAGGRFKGTHRGLCRDWDDADAWLRGETPTSFVVVYPPELYDAQD